MDIELYDLVELKHHRISQMAYDANIMRVFGNYYDPAVFSS